VSKASPNIVIARVVTAIDRAKRAEFFGRKRGQPHGTYVTDLAELKKAIALCWKCKYRWNPTKYGYRLEENIPTVISKCDGCREKVDTAWLYIHEEILLKVSVR
jgi:hypothetical protein